MGPDAEAHAAVAQERARVQVHELREAQDLRVELHGPIDVADGEAEMVHTLRGDLIGHADSPSSGGLDSAAAGHGCQAPGHAVALPAMKCVRCQHESPPAAKFCVEGAAPLAAAVTCARCGTRLPPGAEFCPECALPPGAGAPPPPTHLASPREHKPTHTTAESLHPRRPPPGGPKNRTPPV